MRAPVLVLPWLLGGCMEGWPDYLKPGYEAPLMDWNDTGWSDSGGCWRQVPTELEGFSWSMQPPFWTWRLYLLGWGVAARLDLVATTESGVWTETHDLLNSAYDTCGQWDQWEILLEVVDNPGDQTAGVSTLFPADAETDAILTRMATWWSYEGNEPACVVYGYEPSLFADFGCVEMEVAP